MRFDRSLDFICDSRSPLAALSNKFAKSVRKHGYESLDGIIASIDECLIASFEHSGDRIDLDRELVAVNPEEPDNDKFLDWLSPLPPKAKCKVGNHMAKNDIGSDWSHRLEASITGRAKVTFESPEQDKTSQIRLNERLGPPNRYSDLPDDIAELLAIKHLNQFRSYQLRGGPPFQPSHLHMLDVPVMATPDRPPIPERFRNHMVPQADLPIPVPGHVMPAPVGRRPQNLGTPLPSHDSPMLQLARPYMAGTGRFLTAVRLKEQIAGEHPYAYANNNPVTYTDPDGLQPRGGPSKPNPRCLCIPFPHIIGYPKNGPAMGCLARACTSWCAVITPSGDPEQKAKDLCKYVGQAKHWNDLYPACTFGPAWEFCGRIFTEPGGTGYNDANANYSNWPKPLPQFAGTSLAWDWCEVECKMRVCCHLMQNMTTYLKYLDEDMKKCLGKK